jgi:hypothetical protein
VKGFSWKLGETNCGGRQSQEDDQEIQLKYKEKSSNF